MVVINDVNPVKAASEGGRILVVDDQAVVLGILRNLLGSRDHQVRTAEGGEEALAVAREFVPELVLLDYMLPDMTGEEVCRALQAHPTTAGVPVLMITAEDSVEVARNCLEAGASDFVRKPFSPVELIARVQAHLEAGRNAARLRLWKQTMERDLKLAGSLQTAITSARPLVLPRLRAQVLYRPSLHVGGDFVDLLSLADGRVVFYVGDVAGHGVGAALVGSFLKSTLSHLIWERPHVGLVAWCNELQDAFRQRVDDPSMYATLLVGEVEPEKGAIRYLRCGHPAPKGWGLNIRGEGGRAGPVGFPKGDGPAFREDQVVRGTFLPDGGLVAVTDGLLEAQVAGSLPGDLDFGTDGIPDWVANRLQTGCLRAGLADVVERVEAEGFEFADDCTLLALRLLPPSSVLFHWTGSGDAAMPASVAGSAVEALGLTGHRQAEGVVQLLLLEHLGNGVTHGRWNGTALIEVQVERDGGELVVWVREPDSAWRRPRGTGMPDLAAESGRGLSIIERLVCEMDIIRQGGDRVTSYRLSHDGGIL